MALIRKILAGLSKLPIGLEVSRQYTAGWIGMYDERNTQIT